jgi:hypothetical protein
MDTDIMIEQMKKIKELADIPMTNDVDTKRVEIIMLKFKEEPNVINESIGNIVNNTDWPFKLVIFDNRLNTANTSRAWNKLISESTCQYICIIDSDCFIPKLSPCWLTRMMESINETGIVIPMVDNTGSPSHKSSKAKEYPSTTINKGIWSGMCFLFKKSVYERLGVFDDRFYLYGQDSEWAHRTSKTGGVAMRKDVLIHHIGNYSMRNNENASLDKIYASELYKHLTK